MSRYVVTLYSSADRARAMQIILAAPTGTRVEVKAAKRTNDQNARMWCLLTDIAQQLPWHGQKLRPDDWKTIFLDALKRDHRMVPNIDGNGFVDLSRSSSDLSKGEMSDLMELITEFGVRHGVKFQDDAEAA